MNAARNDLPTDEPNVIWPHTPPGEYKTTGRTDPMTALAGRAWLADMRARPCSSLVPR